MPTLDEPQTEPGVAIHITDETTRPYDVGELEELQAVDPVNAAGPDGFTTMNFVDDIVAAMICPGSVTYTQCGDGDVNGNGSLSPGDALCAFKCNRLSLQNEIKASA